MNDGRKTILVYSDWHADGLPRRMGELHIQSVRRKEIFAFAFDPAWLKTNDARILDPDLQLYGGPQYSDGDKGNFGLFLDSSPDRWGRQLMRRREAIRARKEERAPQPLQESDYLLGVYDATRMGAIRFKLTEDGEFVNSDRAMAAPPWTSLRELEAACRNYEDESQSDDEHEKWLSMLIAPGSSLGGARPKANVLDPEGTLWIAKCPSNADPHDTAAWELVTHELARQAGLRLPECRLEQFSKYGSTFLTRRFDRDGNRRIHFASAMTLLGKTDGTDYQDGTSYLDIAQFITRYGAQPEADLQELWKRIVFSIAVKNTDDHLRNHGFLLTPQGWILSPAYDINPNPDGTGLALNISEHDNALNFDLTREVAPFFRISAPDADSLIEQTRNIVQGWRAIADRYNLSRSAQNNMNSAFLTVGYPA